VFKNNEIVLVIPNDWNTQILSGCRYAKIFKIERRFDRVSYLIRFINDDNCVPYICTEKDLVKLSREEAKAAQVIYG
jgi:hypothetical protein